MFKPYIEKNEGRSLNDTSCYFSKIYTTNFYTLNIEIGSWLFHSV